MSHGRRRLDRTSLLFALGSVCFAAASFASQWASVSRPGIGVTFFVGSLLFTGGGLSQLHSERDLASAIQLAGTLFFNVSTFAGMDKSLDAHAADLRVWAPDVLGSVCFLVSSALAYRAQHPSRSAALNLLGSVAFGVAAITSLIEPSTNEPVSAAIANATTTIGALCFLTGALVPARHAPVGAAPGLA